MRDIPTRPFGRDSLRNFVKRNLIIGCENFCNGCNETRAVNERRCERTWPPGPAVRAGAAQTLKNMTPVAQCKPSRTPEPPFPTRAPLAAGPQWVRERLPRGGSLRWRQFRGHPAAGQPHYGIIYADQVRYRAPMDPSLLDALDSDDPLFRLNTDKLGRF